MKTINSLTLILIMVIAGCTKETDNENQTATHKELRLHAVKRAYYNHQNMRYETNMFSVDSTSFFYFISVEAGKKYRVLVYGPYMENVELVLAKEDSEEPMATGVQANVGNTAKYFVLEAANSEKLLLQVKSNGSSLHGQEFFLTFEEMGTYQITWNGYTWLCDGDWEVNDSGYLMIKGYKSGFSKWAQLIDTTLTDFSTELDFETNEGSLPNFIGISVNANSEIFDMINLPKICRQFKISGEQNWELWTINIENGGGIGRDMGYLPSPLTSGVNTLSAICGTDSTEWNVNQSVVTKKESTTGFHGFYLTFEDMERDSVVFREIRFN